MDALLPACMMPDGGDPCAAFTGLQEKIEQLRTTSAVIERIAAEQLSDPASDDLTIPLAIDLANCQQKLAATKAEHEAALSDLMSRSEEKIAGIGSALAQEKTVNAALLMRVAALEAAIRDLLALPCAAKDLEFLDRGIGTATPVAAWLRARAALAAGGEK